MYFLSSLVDTQLPTKLMPSKEHCKLCTIFISELYQHLNWISNVYRNLPWLAVWLGASSSSWNISGALFFIFLAFKVWFNELNGYLSSCLYSRCFQTSLELIKTKLFLYKHTVSGIKIISYFLFSSPISETEIVSYFAFWPPAGLINHEWLCIHVRSHTIWVN